MPPSDQELCLQIADLRVRLRLPAALAALAIPDVYHPFRFTEPCAPDVHIQVRVEPPPPVQGRLLFSSGGLWRLYEHMGTRQIALFVPARLKGAAAAQDAVEPFEERAKTPPATLFAHRQAGMAGIKACRPSRPMRKKTASAEGEEMAMDRLGVFRRDFTGGELYAAPEFALQKGGREGIFPFSYPLDELLFINLLAQGRGVEVHGCGVCMAGDGLLFVGSSGAGKSTLGRLMAGRPDVTVLSDDRSIIRRIAGRWWVFGTPWHGTARAYAASRAELKRIFVLRHAPTNTARRLSQPIGAAMLVARSFPTYWDAEGMKYTLDLVEKVTADIPIYDLGFAPTMACVDFIRGL